MTGPGPSGPGLTTSVIVALAALLPAAVLTGCSASVAGPIEVEATPITLDPERLTGVSILRSWELTSSHPAFGGLSGLLIEPTDEDAEGAPFIAVSDRGTLLKARYRPDAETRPLTEARLTPLVDEAGEALSGRHADAEALARVDETLLVSFERDHRILGYRAGRVVVRVDTPFRGLANNGGLEALTAIPSDPNPDLGAGSTSGSVIAIGEEPVGGASPVFLFEGGLNAQSTPLRRDLRLAPPHRVTAADIGPDGRLYILRRHYDPSVGVSILVEALPLPAILAPDGPTRPEPLAAFGSDSGIDNMEGIAAWRHADGTTRLTLLADDNFNASQRTLLVEMVLAE
ncbi:MAG: esterase-like activity of phytase family protein [Pseudomonadota bacterium]